MPNLCRGCGNEADNNWVVFSRGRNKCNRCVYRKVPDNFPRWCIAEEPYGPKKIKLGNEMVINTERRDKKRRDISLKIKRYMEEKYDG